MTKLQLPVQHQAIFDVITQEADKLNVDAYVVGGYVRDMLLGMPNKDIDVVCIGPGIELASAVAKRFNRKAVIYQNFGTAAVMLEDGLELEFVGARKESYDRGSRKPVVEDGTLQDDLMRRDFTINALAISLNGYEQGFLIDMFRGVRDLHEKVLRTPVDPKVTFSDDPLRMLRAVRFATKYGMTIEEKTEQAIDLNIKRMEIVSAERVTEEMNKMIKGPKAGDAFRMMHKFGFLDMYLPELTDLNHKGEGSGFGCKNNMEHTFVVLDHAVALTDDVWIRWAAVFHDIGKGPTGRVDPDKGWTFHDHENVGAKMLPEIFKRMKHPLGEELRFVQKLVAMHGQPKVMVNAVTDSAVRRLIFNAGEDIDALMILVRSDYSTTHPDRIARNHRHCDTVEAKIKEVEALDSMRAFRPAVSGEDLMREFNIKPSKEVGILKNALTEAILDGHVVNEYEPGIAWVRAYRDLLLQD